MTMIAPDLREWRPAIKDRKALQMTVLRLWHGSMTPVEEFAGTPSRAELHLGSFKQARMRGHRHLYLFEVDPGKTRRVRDSGEVGRTVCAAARRSGFDAVVYLNRWEGMSAEHVERAIKEGVSDRLDRMSDRDFLKWFPEAQDSWAILDPSRARLIASFDGVSAAQDWMNGAQDLTPGDEEGFEP